jgi:hypothetical protein
MANQARALTCTPNYMTTQALVTSKKDKRVNISIRMEIQSDLEACIGLAEPTATFWYSPFSPS